jgi:hypothetical protein
LGLRRQVSKSLIRTHSFWLARQVAAAMVCAKNGGLRIAEKTLAITEKSMKSLAG